MLFLRKKCILEKYLYVSHTLLILYLEGNHTLFGEKFYFILKFSSGNTGYLKTDLIVVLVFVWVKINTNENEMALENNKFGAGKSLIFNSCYLAQNAAI